MYEPRDNAVDYVEDTEIEHAKRAPGLFLGVGEPPAGYGRPRICGLCGCVFYPKETTV